MSRPPRNPRRAYDADGREIRPATISDLKALGCRTRAAECDAYHREAVVDVSGFPDALPLPDVALKLRCAQCRSKRIRIRLNIAECYEALERKTGWSARR